MKAAYSDAAPGFPAPESRFNSTSEDGPPYHQPTTGTKRRRTLDNREVSAWHGFQSSTDREEPSFREQRGHLALPVPRRGTDCRLPIRNDACLPTDVGLFPRHHGGDRTCQIRCLRPAGEQGDWL